MKRAIIIFLAVFFSQTILAQTPDIKLDPAKVQKFGVYVIYKHSYEPGFEVWKENNKLLYAKEMWYYTESFYIKRDHFPDGLELNEEIIDVSRWEKYRKPDEEVFLRVQGFKDALVLIPGNKVFYKPN
jgi:hypothetical protein